MLAGGEIFGLVGDQGRGLEIDFFGMPTAFPKGPASIARNHNASMYFTVCIRNGKYLDIEFIEQIPIQDGETEAESVEKTTIYYAQRLQELVSKYPEQYFWLHDLWKQFKKKKPAIEPDTAKEVDSKTGE